MADAEDKLVDHLKKVWANGVALSTKVEGYSLMAQGDTMLATHHNYKRVAKKLEKHNHKVGHSLRYLNEVPPASVARVAELTEIQDAESVPDIHEINSQLYQDFEIAIERIVKAHKRAHETEQFAIAGILSKYMTTLQHYAWHALAATEAIKPEEDDTRDAQGEPSEKPGQEI